jgi:hypothetical protein
VTPYKQFREVERELFRVVPRTVKDRIRARFYHAAGAMAGVFTQAGPGSIVFLIPRNAAVHLTRLARATLALTRHAPEAGNGDG